MVIEYGLTVLTVFSLTPVQKGCFTKELATLTEKCS
jgi:hypothetical protein